MKYLENHVDLRADISRRELLEGGADVVVVVALPYAEGTTQEGFWRHVACHARGRDYHKTLKKKLGKMGLAICERFPKVRSRAIVDSAPVLERTWAVAAGIGEMGKSGALIVPGIGPRVLLGELLLKGPLPDVPRPEFAQKNFALCKDCDACIRSCPTGAIVAPGVVDSRRCLSYWTIEAPGEIPNEFAEKTTKIFGCDICTAVCPRHNPEVPCALEPIPTDEGRRLSLEEALAATDLRLENALAGTALRRTGAPKLKKTSRALVSRGSERNGRDMTNTLSSGPRISVQTRNVKKTIDPRTVKRRGVEILKALGLKDSELSILLCDDPVIQALNKDYRNKNAPTDVLSFSMNEGDTPVPMPQLLGDVVISVETARRQALDLGHSLLDEVTSLLIHGILHLVGHTHDTPEEEHKMFSKAAALEQLFHKHKHPVKNPAAHSD